MVVKSKYFEYVFIVIINYIFSLQYFNIIKMNFSGN